MCRRFILDFPEYHGIPVSFNAFFYTHTHIHTYTHTHMHTCTHAHIQTVVLVADRGEGFSRRGTPTNLINLNIGDQVEGVLPNKFWQRLTNKLGNKFYVQEKGEDIAVINAVEAISYCLETKDCVDLPFDI